MTTNKFISRIFNNNKFDNLLLNSDSFLEKKEQSISVKQELPTQENCRFYKIESLTHDRDFPAREALENVLSSMDNSDFNFVYILSGENSVVSLYVGVVKNNLNNYSVNANDYARRLEMAFIGNFNGSQFTSRDGESIKKEIFLEGAGESLKRQGIICGIPSLTKGQEGNEGFLFQGVDRLVNSMAGKMKWRLTVVCQPIEEPDIIQMQNQVCNLADDLAIVAKQSFQQGASETLGFSTSKAESKNKSETWSESNSESSQSNSESKTHGGSTTEGSSTTDGASFNIGKSSNVTTELTNKKATRLLKYLDDELLQRLDLGLTKGLFKTTVFIASNSNEGYNRLRCNLLSLFQGDSSSFAPLMAEKLDDFDTSKSKSCQLFCTPESIIKLNPNIPLIYSRPYATENNELQYATYLTSREVSILAGIPLREVCGIKLKQTVEFGLNFNQVNEKNDVISLGSLVQMNIPLENQPFELNKNILCKHIFASGTTGSGKTTSCQKILLESDLPFLVIEPAKTEYRGIKDENIITITVGDESRIPLRFNMFELLEGESISSHIDQLKATFTNAFPMEASMPMMLEEAMYLCYEKYGWNTRNSEYTENKIIPYKFPILADMFQALNEVVDSKGFGDGRLSGDYKGSLVSRISNLTKGVKGAMLNTRKSFDFKTLLDNKVIFELEAVQSQEEKSFLMGLILARLSYAIKLRFAEDKNFRHITLIEEAHHLLSRVEHSDNGAKRNAVEMFSNMLAEVRKYGEALIIVDQSPNKMTPEVLKNTNTKIIHRLFDQDDKDCIGNTMMMNSKQKDFLSNLEVGHAIVFSENTDKPIHIKINKCENADTSDNDITDEELMSRWNAKKEQIYDYDEEIDLDYLRDETNKLIEELKGKNAADLWGANSEQRERYLKIYENIKCQDKDKMWLEIFKESIFVYGSINARRSLQTAGLLELAKQLKEDLWDSNKAICTENFVKYIGNITNKLKV